MFALYLDRWALVPDGAALHTPSSDLLPVRAGARPAMLKLPRADEERAGGQLMPWWNGEGAARVYRHDPQTGALLLERALGKRSLARLAEDGQDDEASRVLCAVADRLHAPRPVPPPDLVPLESWFRALWNASARLGGMFQDAEASARALLGAPQDVTVLHGDLHHGNVLDGGERGWLAIDPKGLRGERGFDYANIFFNPTLAFAGQPGRLARQAQVVAAEARLERRRLLGWVLAYAGLSAAWWLEDAQASQVVSVLEVARLAAAELGR